VTDAIDKLHTTGESHKRIMVVEVMGRYAGWIAMYSAIAGGADVCLIPEIEYDFEKIVKHIEKKKNKYNKKYMIVVVSEGAIEKEGNLIVKTVLNDSSGLDNIRLGGAGDYVAKRLEELTNIPARNTTLRIYTKRRKPSCTR
jgi:phosphofructokinase